MIRVADRTREEYARLRSALREIRTERGLSQRQVAQRMSLWQEWVQKSESGERRLDVVELYDVAAALGVDVVEILRRAGLTQL